MAANGKVRLLHCLQNFTNYYWEIMCNTDVAIRLGDMNYRNLLANVEIH